MAKFAQHSGTLFQCPACETDVEGTFFVEFSLTGGKVEMGPDGTMSVGAQANVTGVKVVHDCGPKRAHRSTKAVADAEAAPAAPVAGKV